MRAEVIPPVLDVSDLTIELGWDRSVRAVDGASFRLAAGEILAVVGESGSGKSVLLKSLLGLVPATPGIIRGRLVYHFRDGVCSKPLIELRNPSKLEQNFAEIRDSRVGLVLQNGSSALDPFWTVGAMLEVSIARRFPRLIRAERTELAHHWLQRLGIEEPLRVSRSRPHQLSGGSAQRAMLAVVLARDPEILLLDEVTTGLDVSVTSEVIKVLAALHEERNFSGILVTHDLGVARALAKRTMVMERGRLLVQPRSGANASSHTNARPLRIEAPSAPPPSPSRPILEVHEVEKDFAARPGWLGRRFGRSLKRNRALAPVSLSAAPGERIAIVGESGSGKTTLARILVTLLRPDQGSVVFDGVDPNRLERRRLEETRRRFQILFQNPYSSLNPEMACGRVIEESLQIHRGLSPAAARTESSSLLQEIGLLHRSKQKVRDLSGGERRRVGLIRAFASRSDLLVLDEPTAGLDALHRGKVVEMIERGMQQHPSRVLIVISHDLGFVARTVDRVLVLYRGQRVDEFRISELSRLEQRHSYTQRLWNAAAHVSAH